MSNVAGKSYAMNTLTPLKWHTAWINKVIFRERPTSDFFSGLEWLDHVVAYTLCEMGNSETQSISQT